MAALVEHNIPPGNLFIEKQSGKDFDRPKWKRLMKRLRPGDLLIGVSTSGNAKNVAAAVIAARAAGVATLGLSGRDGGELARLCDECLVMPEHETYRIQEYHIAVYHLLCAAVESELFEH